MDSLRRVGYMGATADTETMNSIAPVIDVVLVDGHTVVRAALRAWLEKQGTVRVRGEAASAPEALALVQETRPHVLVFDWHLETGAVGGTSTDLEALRALLEAVALASPDTRVVGLTTQAEWTMHHEMVVWGARGLVFKEADPETLVRAIERVHAGDVWLERSLLADVLHGIRVPRKSEPHEDQIGLLTRREREVVALVGAGHNNRSIVHALFITETTVRHHLTSAFSKLGVSNRLECALFAIKHSILNQDSTTSSTKSKTRK